MNKKFRRYTSSEALNTDVQSVEDFRKLICYYRVWEIDLFLAKAGQLIAKRKGVKVKSGNPLRYKKTSSKP